MSTAARAAMIAAATFALAGCSGSDDPDPTSQETTLVPSGDCPGESDAVAAARRGSAQAADIDGDGAADAVYIAKDPAAEPSCRTFVVVDTGDVTYAANASVLGDRQVRKTAIFRLIQLGGSDGAEIVFSANGTEPESFAVYKLFTFDDGELRPIAGPYRDVVDGPYGHPVGAGCASDGRLVISEASGSDPHRQRTVDRRFFTLNGDSLEPSGEMTRRIGSGRSLTAAWPEFRRPLFGRC